MKNILFIHGAWGGAWEFQEFTDGLNRRGHHAIAIDLPGHGRNQRPISEVTMDAYVKHVIEATNAFEGTIVLIGHSLAGSIVSQVAERIPEKIERLIYVAATLPQSGESVLGLMEGDKAGQLLPRLIFSEDGSIATLAPGDVEELLLHDVDEPERRKRLIPRFDIEQATEPFAFQASLTEERFGSVPKVYLRASDDKIISPILQEKMISNWEVERVFTLESGHFPMISLPETFLELIQVAIEPAHASS